MPRAGIRRIPNPYAGSDTYRCFGCSPDNPIGLQLTFALQGERVIAEWSPRSDLEGYPGVVHGGIQATLADETAAWYIHAMLGTAGVTRELNVRYHQRIDLVHLGENSGPGAFTCVDVDLFLVFCQRFVAGLVRAGDG